MLLKAEAENNLALGVAIRFAGGVRNADPENYWATIEQEGEVRGCAFRTPPFPVAVTAMPPEAIAPLVGDLSHVFASLPGVNGPAATAEAFAGGWAARHGTTWAPERSMMIHRLTTVTFPENPPTGALRPAAAEELGLLREWHRSFVHDTGTREWSDDFVDRAARAGRLFVWSDAAPRSMVAAARGTPNGACINAVYTPDPWRRRGYATAAVAAMSQRLLHEGKAFCCLYTDLANPTSNSIYRSIGYAPIREDVDIRFGANASS